MIKEKYSKNNKKITLVTLKNGHLGISLDENDNNFLCLSQLMKEKFDLKEDGKLIMDIVGDEGSQKFKNEKYQILIGWNFMEIYIDSIDENSNKLIEEIFEWLQTIDIPVECN
jgi:hypothetical protein